MLKCLNEVMKVSAKLNYLRIAPRKVRLVADLIRGKSVEEAQTILNFTRKRATTPLSKLLKSAVANAQHNFQLTKDNLYIAEIRVDEGPKLKRWRPRARGQAFEIQKKTSHILLVLDDHPPTALPRKRAPEIEGRPKKVKKKAKKPKRAEKPKKERPPKKGKPPKERPKLRPKSKAPKPKPKKKGRQPTHHPPARGGPLRRFFRRKAF